MKLTARRLHYVFVCNHIYDHRSLRTVRESAARTAELFASRAFRQALLQEGLAIALTEALAAALGGAGSEGEPPDPVVMLGAAAVLGGLASPDCGAVQLAAAAPIALLRRLLSAPAAAASAACPGGWQGDPSAQRIARLHTIQHLGRARPAPLDAPTLALAALSAVLDPNACGGGARGGPRPALGVQAAHAAARLKDALVTAGAIGAVLQFAVDAWTAVRALLPAPPASPAPDSASASRALFLGRLSSACALAEQITFAHDVAGTWAAECSVQVAGGADVTAPEALLPIVRELGPHAWSPLGSEGEQESVRRSLTALTNLAHQHEGAASVLGEQGALAAGCHLLAALVGPLAGQGARAPSFPALLAHLDDCNLVVAFLVNVAEDAKAARTQALRCRVPVQGSAAPIGCVPFLCLMLSSAESLAGGDAGPAPDEAVAGEVTEEAVARRERAGEAAMIALYLSVLLGLVIAEPETGAEAAAEVERSIPGGGLAAVRRGVADCLGFYSRCGALTKKMADSLNRLLVHLEALAPIGGSPRAGTGGESESDRDALQVVQ